MASGPTKTSPCKGHAENETAIENSTMVNFSPQVVTSTFSSNRENLKNGAISDHTPGAEGMTTTPNNDCQSSNGPHVGDCLTAFMRNRQEEK